MNGFMRRLPLEGLYNARELGGFTTNDGKVTNYNTFVRSELPRKVTDKDIAFMREYGIQTSVDLRGHMEVERMPSLLKDAEGIKYIHIPMDNNQAAAGAVTQKDKYARHPGEPIVPWGKLYIGMAEDFPEWTKNVLETAAECAGTMHFHCTTGKDRTGMITAYLLSIAGVDEADIIADYSVSMIYMRPVYMELTALMPPLKDENGNIIEMTLESDFFKTNPGNMREFLDHMNKNHGGIVNFALSCGTAPEAIEAIRHKLTD